MNANRSGMMIIIIVAVVAVVGMFIMILNQNAISKQVEKINQGADSSGQVLTSYTCSGSSTQSCTISKGNGSRSRTCNSGTWSSWGTCTAISCNSGYVISGNACVKGCTGVASQPCAIANGEGFQSRTCSNNVWSNWSDCIADDCNVGYIQKGANHCVPATCSGSSTQSCNVTNGYGIQGRSCNSGTWSNWSNCTATGCNSSDYVVNGGVCVCTGLTDSRTCYIANAITLQYRQCTSGVSWSAWGACTLIRCNLNYVVNGNSCVPICNDSDGGNKIYSKGTATARNSAGAITSVATDFCYNSNAATNSCTAGSNCILMEYNCDYPNGDITKTFSIIPSLVSCPNGCSNGACLP